MMCSYLGFIVDLVKLKRGSFEVDIYKIKPNMIKKIVIGLKILNIILFFSQ